ncbi:MAG: glycosyltransferase, partial [bacterium]|nr:glycosyltransferase [bacterium]
VVHGENGFLVPPRDSSALAEAIAELINDPLKRKRMGKAGREMVLRLGLTWDDIARKYLLLYRELNEKAHRKIEEK